MNDLSWPEWTFYQLGLTSPAKRFVAGFTMGNLVMLTVKPRISFDRDGEPKSFSLSGRDRNTTTVPWWIPGILLGGSFAMFF